MKIHFTLAIYHVTALAAFAKGSPPESVIENKDNLSAAIRSPSRKTFLRGGRKGETLPGRRRQLETGRKLETIVVDDFVGVGTGGCDGRNELGIFDDLNGYQCASKCRNNDECVSFEWKGWWKEEEDCTLDVMGTRQCWYDYHWKTRCALSSSCVGPDQTNYQNTDDDHLYVKIDRIPNAAHVDGYVAVKTGGCPSKNELGITEESTAQDCADKCSQETDCVSFEFGKINRRCALSSSCDSLSLTVENLQDPNYWYAKDYESGKGVQNNAVQESWNGSDLFYSYDVDDTKSCAGKTEIGGYSGEHAGKSLEECAELCENESDCLSFSYPKFETGLCLLSSICDDVSESVEDAGDENFLFTRKQCQAGIEGQFCSNRCPCMNGNNCESGRCVMPTSTVFTGFGGTVPGGTGFGGTGFGGTVP